jgi:glycosyltransferase involved in cell wall biosynthesis
MRLVINGRCLGRATSGVERYAVGLIGLALREWPDARVFVPPGTPIPLDMPPAAFKEVGASHGQWWEQVDLPAALTSDDVLLSPANMGPLCWRQQVVVVHDLAVWRHPGGFSLPFRCWYKLLVPRLVKRCVRIIAVSHTMSSELTHHFALPPGKVMVVPPVPWDALSGVPVGPHGSGRPFLLALGAHDARKGIDRLVEWYRARPERPFDLVLLHGAGRAFRSPLPVQGPGIKVLGHVSDDRLAGLYRTALALVHPSAYEGFGLPVLEAMLAGCPVIATDLPAVREGFAGAYVPVLPGDADSWESALVRVSDLAQRERLIAAGKAAAANFGPARSRQALLDALRPWIP